jgi:error-prone DNA polymerase
MATGASAHLMTRCLGPGYVELHAHSSHSLLDGVPSPEALATRAADLGMPALALTDHNALYGAVRFVLAAQEVGIKPILGAEMTLEDGAHLTLLAETADGYANLCQLITLSRREKRKGAARLSRHDLAEHSRGLIGLSGCCRGDIPRLLIAGKPDAALEIAKEYARIFGRNRFFIELQHHYQRGEHRLLGQLLAVAGHAGLDVVATGNVHYLHWHQRQVHDVLVCIREHTTLELASGLLRSNSEYLLRTPEEMATLFSRVPNALENSLRIAERCANGGTLLPTRHQMLPHFCVPGKTAYAYLRELCVEALHDHYGDSPPYEQLERELAIIKQADLAEYFLIVWDIVRFARNAGIRCQGRGSAANSLVAYLLGITPIDPIACDLVFERFLSAERPNPPDIDVDFAANRREEVIQYVYQRYGSTHAAMACTMVTFRARSAVRDVARVLGFPPPLVARLARELDVRNAASIQESQGLIDAFGTDLAGKPFQNLLSIVPQLDGLPRHLGIHNGGMVLSGPPLCEMVPLEPATMPDRVVTQWDKGSLEDAGLIKIDLLGLRMLSAIDDAGTMIKDQTGKELCLDALSYDDPAVYDMLCRGQTIGVFQVESRAQANLIPRFQPRCFADLVVEISLIRPGPIQGDMVHPYLRRRLGLEAVTYLHQLLEPALAETHGVIVYQEQVLKVARDLAGFATGRAEVLRRALSHKRAAEQLARFHEEFISGAVARQVPPGIAEQVFKQLQAFGSYAFPKSHAAAFAVLTYQSAWLRRYYPAAFFASLLRNQPMGFYPPHVIVSEARRSGVEILPVDIATSDFRTTAEENALRLGLEIVSSLGEAVGRHIIEARSRGPFKSLADFCRRTQLGRRTVEALIWSGAFDGWGIPRRQMLWDLQEALEMAQAAPSLELPRHQDTPRFGPLSPQGRTRTEMAFTGVSARTHLTTLVKDRLQEMDVMSSAELSSLWKGSRVSVGGLIASAQRPPTAKGVAFLALEDEAGMINIILHPQVYEASRKALRSPFVVVEGELQKQGNAVSVLAHRVIPLQLQPD